jgi:hypothetical protein
MAEMRYLHLDTPFSYPAEVKRRLGGIYKDPISGCRRPVYELRLNEVAFAGDDDHGSGSDR